MQLQMVHFTDWFHLYQNYEELLAQSKAMRAKAQGAAGGPQAAPPSLR